MTDKAQKIKKNDIILISALLLVSLALLCAVLLFSNTDTEEAVVRVDGKEAVRLPLDKDTEYLIEGVGGSNLLVIKNGEAFITEADCPDKVCVRTGKASNIKSLVCLPHKVVVTVE